MSDAELEQRSPEWLEARCGYVTASRISDVMAKGKSGYLASRDTYMAEVICERLTKQPVVRFQNDAMKWGVEREPEARLHYELTTGIDVVQVGFIKHPRITFSGASPDGMVGDEGLLEIKCPNTSTHIDTLLSGTVASKYIYQIQWQMACTNRMWCDFQSFDPRLPTELKWFCKRIERNEAMIADIEIEVCKFLEEVAKKIMRLNAISLEKVAA